MVSESFRIIKKISNWIVAAGLQPFSYNYGVSWYRTFYIAKWEIWHKLKESYKTSIC